ncbi:MAG: hypothetical protein JOZ49_08600 [Mycolicibacterium sp.]|nr:hypothetical protein [Mycolicibacterium sp.]
MTDPHADLVEAIEHIRTARYCAQDAAHSLPHGPSKTSVAQLVERLVDAEAHAERLEFFLQSDRAVLHAAVGLEEAVTSIISGHGQL